MTPRQLAKLREALDALLKRDLRIDYYCALAWIRERVKART